MSRVTLFILALALIPVPGWSQGLHRTPGEGVEWEIVNVEGTEFVCFTTRRGAIDCHVLACPEWDPERLGRVPAECRLTPPPGRVIE